MKGKYFELRPECQEEAAWSREAFQAEQTLMQRSWGRYISRYVAKNRQNMVLQQSMGGGEDWDEQRVRTKHSYFTINLMEASGGI